MTNYSISSIRNGSSTVSTSAREIGTSFTANRVYFSVTGTVTVGAISTTGAANNLASEDVGNTSYQSFTSTSFTRNTPGNITFNLTSNVGTKTKSYSYKAYNYFGGYGNISSYTSANVNSLISSLKTQRKSFDTNKAWNTTGNTQTATPGNYAYIVYPYSYGNFAVKVNPGTYNIPDQNNTKYNYCCTK